jgi:hypothetical protein
VEAGGGDLIDKIPELKFSRSWFLKFIHPFKPGEAKEEVNFVH